MVLPDLFGSSKCIDLPVVQTESIRSAIDPIALESLLLKDRVAELAEARFIYNRVTQMWRGQPVHVVLRLALADEELPDLPDSLPGDSVERTIPVTPTMSAQMTGGPGFEVELIGESEKRVSDIAPVKWEWHITPTIAGPDQPLTLSIYLHLPDEEVPILLKAYEDEVLVDVTNWQQAKDLAAGIKPIWVFLVGAVPVAWGAYTWIRGRKWNQTKD